MFEFLKKLCVCKKKPKEKKEEPKPTEKAPEEKPKPPEGSTS